MRDVAQERVRTDRDGLFAHSFGTLTGGSYIVRATYTGANNVATVSERYLSVGGADERIRRIDNSSITSMTTNDVSVNVGDTVDLILQSPIDE